MRRVSLLGLLVASSIVASAAHAQVLQLGELNTGQIRALDRDRTIVLIPGGILEQHGPYLPSFTDGYRNDRATGELARAVAARPGWAALVFPTIPLGVGGANEIGGHYSFTGSYAVRSRTLRDVFLDLGSELGEQGFRWIFVVHLHGAPAHSRALDVAGDYFRDTYGGRMVHLYGLMPVLEAGAQHLDPAEAAENGLDIHAGRTETSAVLSLRPDLVAPGYRTAPPLPGKNFDELVRIARTTDWPGYFGAPRQATAAEGKARFEQRTQVAADFMWSIVEGTADEREIPRYAATRPEASLRIVRAAAAEERAREKRFAAWLAQRQTPPRAAVKERFPIIDMHLHALPGDVFGPPPQLNPATGQPSAATTEEAIREASLAALERYNIVRAVTSGPLAFVEAWRARAPARIIPAILLVPGIEMPTAEMRAAFQDGRLAVLGEVGAQYMGLTLASAEMAPYVAMAEELDVPVALHTGLGPPGASYGFAPRFRAALGNPLLIEEALVRHPKLRVYLMHAGFPFLEETIALMHAHPQVYADISVINWALDRSEFHDYLRRLMQHTDCGLPQRLMFGSDQMIWPEAIGMAIEGVESAAFLSEDQKRDIFCRNAARFLRLEAQLCE